MIFVILGITILIISFFIALASLIREQDKTEGSSNEEVLSGSKEREVPKKENLLITHSPPQKVPREEVLIFGQELNTPTTAETVPYPWQQDLQGNQGEISSPDREKIDKIRADIANLTARKKLQDQRVMILPEVSGEVQEEDLDRKLSGEFSLDRYRS